MKQKLFIMQNSFRKRLFKTKGKFLITPHISWITRNGLDIEKEREESVEIFIERTEMLYAFPGRDKI